MEHSCHVCGSALGRVGAPLDPIYKLPIVVCPKCRAACVRRRHPISACWRAVRRGLTTGIGLAWRMLACAVMVGFSLGVCEMLSESLASAGPLEMWGLARRGELDEKWIEGWKLDSGPLIAGVSLAWCIGVGAALTAGFGHARRWVVWLLFAAAMFGFPILVGCVEYVDRAMYQQSDSEAMPALRDFLSMFNRVWGWMAVGLLVAVAGMPLGRGLRRAFDAGDAKRWRGMLRRARRRRMAT